MRALGVIALFGMTMCRPQKAASADAAGEEALEIDASADAAREEALGIDASAREAAIAAGSRDASAGAAEDARHARASAEEAGAPRDGGTGAARIPCGKTTCAPTEYCVSTLIPSGVACSPGAPDCPGNRPPHTSCAARAPASSAAVLCTPHGHFVDCVAMIPSAPPGPMKP
jgi:hypothetical protein